MATTLEAPVHTTVVGVFDDRASARGAMEDLRRAGFSEQQIGFMGPDVEARAGRPPEAGVEEEVGIAAGLGAAAGGAAGLAVALGMLAPVGPIVAGGAIVAYLASIGAGAATGAIVGALLGLGISEPDAHWYEEQLKAGRILVTVHEADERSDDARSILRHNGGSIREPYDIGAYGTGLPATPY